MSFNDYLEMIVTSYYGAITLIMVGIYTIIYTLKNPSKDPFSLLQGDFKGWSGGIGASCLGVFIIIMKLLGKL